jgi:hypothetical protein
MLRRQQTAALLLLLLLLPPRVVANAAAACGLHLVLVCRCVHELQADTQILSAVPMCVLLLQRESVGVTAYLVEAAAGRHLLQRFQRMQR